MRKSEVAQLAGISDDLIGKWISDGLLVPTAYYNRVDFYDRDSVEKLCNEFLRIDDAVKLLGVSRSAFQHWVKLKRIVPVYRRGVDGFPFNLFKREEVETLRATQYLTAPQLAKRMGLTYGCLLGRILSGKIKPVSGPGIDNYGRYLFEIPADKGHKIKPG